MASSGERAPADNTFKVIIIGNRDTGKSSLVHMLTQNESLLNPVYTVQPEVATYQGAFDGKLFRLRIWDTSGEERFRAITRSFFRGVEGALLVYDITDRATFDDMEYWLKEVRAHNESNLVAMLIGNKSDLAEQRAVSTKEGEQFAREHRLLFRETSARTAASVRDSFISLAQRIWETRRPCDTSNEGTIKLGSEVVSKNCCGGGSQRTRVAPQEMEMVNSSQAQQAWSVLETSGNGIPVDITATSKEYVVTCDVPDDARNISVQRRGLLKISYEIARSAHSTYVVTDRAVGTFQRSMSVPGDCNLADLKYTRKGGRLTLRLPRVSLHPIVLT